MEVIKKSILQVLTTGITATTTGNQYIIIPDTGVTYSIKFGLQSVMEDIGFSDAYMLNDPYYYYFVSGDTNMAKFESMLSGGTGVPPILYNSGGYAVTDEPTGSTPTVMPTITGTSLSRLAELRKYTITNVFSKQYVTGGTITIDGVDLSASNTGSSITYYLGGIKYIDVITGTSSGITFNIYKPEGITGANFVNVPYYKNPNKENIISQPNIDDDVFIVRETLSAFDKNYRLEYIRNLSDLTTYAGGNFFNIVNNS